jgi:hypothetical protein
MLILVGLNSKPGKEPHCRVSTRYGCRGTDEDQATALRVFAMGVVAHHRKQTKQGVEFTVNVADDVEGAGEQISNQGLHLHSLDD